MIDNFALGLIHLLLGIAIWKLLVSPELDTDPDDTRGRPDPARKPRRPQR